MLRRPAHRLVPRKVPNPATFRATARALALPTLPGVPSAAGSCGAPIPKFLSACTDARNKIAHHAESETAIPLKELSKALREFVLMLVWTRNKLPNFTLNTPPTAVRIPPGGLSIRVM